MNTMMPFPVIETERPILRKQTDDDIIPMLRLCQDEEVMLYYGKELYKEEKQSKDELDWFIKIWKEGTGLRWIISLKADEKLIGDIGFYDYEKKHRKTEVGYKLASAHWKKGYMSEALEAVLEYIYKETDVNRVQALVDPRNPPSYLLLEKYGFQQEGTLRDYEFEKGDYVDLVILSILRREWDSQ